MKRDAQPAGPFRAILADPPWSYRDRGSRMAPSHAGHYQVQDLDTVKAMGSLVSLLAAPDAFLFLWVPNSLVLDGTGQAVARAWGFEPKQLIPWIKTTADGTKPRLGAGHYTRVVSEQLVLCRRGRAKVLDRGVPGYIWAPRREHSRKPDEQYSYIERLAAGPYLELYARQEWPGWQAWGNQIGALA